MQIDIKNVKDPLVSDEEVINFLQESKINITMENGKFIFCGVEIHRANMILIYKRLLAGEKPNSINLIGEIANNLKFILMEEGRYRKDTYSNIIRKSLKEEMMKRKTGFVEMNELAQEAIIEIQELRDNFVNIKLLPSGKIMFCGIEINKKYVSSIYQEFRSGKRPTEINVEGQTAHMLIEIAKSPIEELTKKDLENFEVLKEKGLNIRLGSRGEILFCNTRITSKWLENFRLEIEDGKEIEEINIFGEKINDLSIIFDII